MAYDFHYTPTGTGVISGKEVLEQTEDAINDLGNTAISGVQEALDKAEQALTNSENAVDDAQTALNTANNAEGVAIQAQTDVGNLSGTVTNIGNRVTTAEGNITNLQGRMTTAEGNITNLQGRMTTAETNIGNLQTAVSTAQATANSAQQTATTARQQSYVFRYSSTALTPSSTNSNALLDNTDNLKVGDKVIDSSGVLFSITAIDTANSTFTVGSALIDLALDANVMHLSGNETAAGKKIFSEYITSDGSSTGDEYSNNAKTNLWLMGTRDTEEVSGVLFDTFRQNTAQGTGSHILGISIKENAVRYEGCRFAWSWDNNLNGYSFSIRPTLQGTNQAVKHNLGTSTDKWSEVHATTYYYGSSDTEFSSKFVTTDTAQTIGGVKTFSDIPVFSTFDGIIFRCAHNSNAYVTFRNVGQGDPGSIVLSAHDGTNGTALHLVNKTLIPYTDSDIDLGTDVRKWKSVSSNMFIGCGTYLGNEASTNQRTSLYLLANRDTNGQSGCYVTRYRQNKAQGALAFSDQQQLGIDFLENSVRTTNLFNIVATDWTNDVPGRILINSGIANNSFGSVARKCLINELNPSSLGMPSDNASDIIDISSYITALDGTSNSYTVPANGWISIAITGTAIAIVSSSWSDSRLRASSGDVRMLYPVLKNETLDISVMGTTLSYARFIPCQGNV